MDINSRQKITWELYECLKVQEILYFKMFSFKRTRKSCWYSLVSMEYSKEGGVVEEETRILRAEPERACIHTDDAASAQACGHIRRSFSLMRLFTLCQGQSSPASPFPRFSAFHWPLFSRTAPPARASSTRPGWTTRLLFHTRVIVLCGGRIAAWAFMLSLWLNKLIKHC